jgi:hypothetical protein
MMMKINNLKFKFLIAFICLLGISKAQNNNDFRAWTSFEISSNLTKKFSLSLKTQLRYFNQLSQLNGVYYSLDANRKLKKKWSIEGGLRFNTSNTWNSFRMRIGIAKKLKINKIELSIRGLYQVQLNEFGFHENYRNVPISSARFKIQAERKLIKHLKIKLFSEPLWRKEGDEVFLRRIRNSAGLSYELNKNLNADIAYLYQPQFYPRKVVNIISFSFSYNLPKMYKKKGKKKVEDAQLK